MDQPLDPAERRIRRHRGLMAEGTILDPVLDPEERARIGFDPDPEARVPVLIELNLEHPESLQGAERRLRELLDAILGDGSLAERIGTDYWRAEVTVVEILELVQADKRTARNADSRAILRVWPDFPVHPQIYRSVATIKADAAQRAFAVTGKGVMWAVIDSGIDASHPHFQTYDTLGGDAAQLHRDFTIPGPPSLGNALTDNFGHGTHMAGIIGGGLRNPSPEKVRVFEEIMDEATLLSE